MCSLQTNVPPYPQSHHHQTTVYSQQLPSAEGPYWLQDAPPQENTVAYCLPNQVPQEASAYGDFPPFAGDLFQPEEIFQLDQPLRPDFPANPQDVARSPPTLLDLGSGTIKYEVKQQSQDQTYWNQFLSEDSSSSHLSLPPQDERLQFSAFEPEKDTNGLPSRRTMHHYVQEKDQNQGHSVNDALHYQSYFRPQNQKSFVDGNSKSEHEQPAFWPQDNQQDNRLHFPSFEVKEEDLLASRREVDCYNNRNGCQTSLAGRTEYSSLYQRPKSEDTQDAVRSSRSPEDRPYPFDGYHHQMFDHGDSKNQPHSRVAHHQNTTRMNLDDRLQTYDNHEAAEAADRLFHGSGATMDTSTVHSQNSPEPFFYPSNERCHYTCEILDRLPQMMGNVPGVTTHGTNVNNYGEQVAADLDLPPFVDYTLVGMLCSSADEEAASSLLPAGCPQDSHSYVPHH